MKDSTFETMIGKTMTSVEWLAPHGDDKMVFTAEDGHSWKFYHESDCCENVYIEDVCGDLSDLVGSPIIFAEEVSNLDDPPKDPEYAESFTWTFYRFGTIKGTVTVRWLGM